MEENFSFLKIIWIECTLYKVSLKETSLNMSATNLWLETDVIHEEYIAIMIYGRCVWALRHICGLSHRSFKEGASHQFFKTVNTSVSTNYEYKCITSECAAQSRKVHVNDGLRETALNKIASYLWLESVIHEECNLRLV